MKTATAIARSVLGIGLVLLGGRLARADVETVHERGDFAAMHRGGLTPTDSKGWTTVALLRARGKYQHVAVDGTVSQVRLVGRKGRVNVRTLLVRQAEHKDSYRVAAVIVPGQFHEVLLPRRVEVSGMRISTGGRGDYEVQIKP